MAADVAPGLLRAEAQPKPGAAPAFGFLRWRRTTPRSGWRCSPRRASGAPPG